MASVEEIQAQIFEYLSKVCGATPKPNDSLAMLGIDSVAMAEITFELEKRFAIRIDDDVLDVATAGELAQYVQQRLGQ